MVVVGGRSHHVQCEKFWYNDKPLWTVSSW